VLSIGAIAAPAMASADATNSGIAVQPRVEVGVARYELAFGSTVQSIVPGEVETSSQQEYSDSAAPTIDAGVTFFADRFYLDLSLRETFVDIDGTEGSFSSAFPPYLVTGKAYYEPEGASRHEYAVALGYGLTDNIAVYAGWKWARNTFEDLQGRGTVEEQLSGLTGTFNQGGDWHFDYDGPFIGTTVGWAIKNGSLDGTLALNVAVAFLDGELSAPSESARVVWEDGREVDFGSASDLYDTTGESVGISLGLSWKGRTNIQGLTYSVGIAGYRYDFEADQEGRADINETYVQLKAGLAYTF
jgi:hypothetical protein